MQWNSQTQMQDGIGSEGQKMFNRHVEIDTMFRTIAFTFSSEVIYDEQGFRRPGFDPGNITWRQIIHHRDPNPANKAPITRVGD